MIKLTWLSQRPQTSLEQCKVTWSGMNIEKWELQPQNGCNEGSIRVAAMKETTCPKSALEEIVQYKQPH